MSSNNIQGNYDIHNKENNKDNWRALSEGRNIQENNEYNQHINKRDNYISWNKYFMEIAILSSMRSKDPNTQVGSCIINNNKIIGIGYNGLPNNINDNDISWTREGINSKYLYVVHAEVNAILNTLLPSLLTGATIYCTLFPCNECVKLIIQSGIKHIIYKNALRQEYAHIYEASIFMLNKVGISITQYNE